MSEMSDMFKLVNAMELAKKARVGMELTYFDVIELLGEINSLYEYIDELESARRWVPVQDIKVGEIYLIDGYDEWDSDRGTEVLDGFTIAKYYGIEDSCRVFADFYGTFLRFDMESDDLRNVYRLPEGA